MVEEWFMTSDFGSNLWGCREVRVYILKAIAAEFRLWASSALQACDRELIRLLQELEMSRAMGVFKDRLCVGPSGKVGSDFTDPDFAQRFPVLYQFVTFPLDDDGNKRQTSTIMIFCEDGQAKACMRERDHGLTLWVSSSSILGCLAALEEGLNETPVPWRATGPSGSTRRVKS